MPRISPPIDTDELVAYYATGVSLGHCARKFKTRSTRVRAELEKAGVHIRTRREQAQASQPPRITIENIDEYATRYLAGEGLNRLAIDAGVAPGTMSKKLRAAGVVIRPRSADAAHAAVRGKKQPDELLRKRAQRNAETLAHVGPKESAFAAALVDLGGEFTQQLAIGKYNVDFALEAAGVAVEIVTGSGNGRIYSGRKQRIEYILDRGWHVVEVMCLGRDRIPTAGSAEYVVALAKLASGQPSGRGHHWMVWSDGEPYAARTRQVNQVA